MLKLETRIELPRSAGFSVSRLTWEPILPLAGQKRSAPADVPHVLEPPAKKQSKWTKKENSKIIELRASNMKWEDISKRLPGRSAISCRLHYQNFLERKPEWDEDKKNKLARLYERFRQGMWEQVARELGMPWRATEAMHWELGAHDMATRAGVQVFTTHSGAQSKQTSFVTAPSGALAPYYTLDHTAPRVHTAARPLPGPAEAPYRYPPPTWPTTPQNASNARLLTPQYSTADHTMQDAAAARNQPIIQPERAPLGNWNPIHDSGGWYADQFGDFQRQVSTSSSPAQCPNDNRCRMPVNAPHGAYDRKPTLVTDARPQLPPLRLIAGLGEMAHSQHSSPDTASRMHSTTWKSPATATPRQPEYASRLLPPPQRSAHASSQSRSQSPSRAS